MRTLQELPGQELFKYRAGADEYQPVGSTEVNEYLREVAGLDVTAKDFRTWGATVAVATALAGTEPPGSPTSAKRAIAAALREAAARLGNTPTVCRKSYVHPVVLEAYAAGGLALATPADPEPAGLTSMEQAVLELLRSSTPASG